LPTYLSRQALSPYNESNANDEDYHSISLFRALRRLDRNVDISVRAVCPRVSDGAYALGEDAQQLAGADHRGSGRQSAKFSAVSRHAASASASPFTTHETRRQQLGPYQRPTRSASPATYLRTPICAQPPSTTIGREGSKAAAPIVRRSPKCAENKIGAVPTAVVRP
jgi:hypothetical protein